MQGFGKLAGEYASMGLVEKPKPEPAPDEALVEVSHAGLCGSDLGIYEFEDAFEFMEFPRIVGHEYSGTVIETGETVSNFEAGDRIVEQIIRHCGECAHCLRGEGQLCFDAQITGIHHDGAYAPYITVPEKDLHHVHDDVALRAAAITEPTSVATRAVRHNSRVSPGDQVLVEGPGPIGLLVAQIARAQGGTVLVSGVGSDRSHRLPMAETLGFETINVAEHSLEAQIDGRTDGLGFDVVFDATGHPSGVETAAEAVRKGGQIVILGLTDHVELSLTPLVRGEVDLQCSYTSDWEDFEVALKLIQNGTVETDPFIDDQFTLENGARAYEAAIAGETVKPVFDLDDLR